MELRKRQVEDGRMEVEEDAADAYTAEKEAAAQAEQDRLKA